MTKFVDVTKFVKALIARFTSLKQEKWGRLLLRLGVFCTVATC
jgi:hypothetical protein